MKREGTDGVSFCPGRHEKVILEGQAFQRLLIIYWRFLTKEKR